ncbi:glycosyltransferase involved in cell wall biosynthesis [Sporosarcina luteola]|nr:glycosyltransferase involved in cell wall biosynthesis [Sporosarcina luteola]
MRNVDRRKETSEKMDLMHLENGTKKRSDRVEKLKVVQLITRLDQIGGAQIHVRDISNYLQRQGHSVHLMTGKVGDAAEDFPGIPIHSIRYLVRELKPLQDVKAFLETRRLLKKVGPDLVATHSSKAGIIGRLAARSLHIPVIFTAHGWSFTDGIPNPKKTFYRCIEKVAGRFASGIIAVSEFDKELALNSNVVGKERIVCIQNGVHELAKHERKSQVNEIPRLVMIARFSPPKKQIELLQALQNLQHLEWTMHFVGDGPEKRVVEEFAKQSGMTHRVVFEGWCNDVSGILEQSDIFILHSKYEGLPLSILEAMRAGLPIIATDVGGVKEAVTTANGLLIRNGDSAALQQALETLILNRSLRLKMGQSGREVFERNFTFQKMITETIDFYWTIVRREDGK